MSDTAISPNCVSVESLLPPMSDWHLDRSEKLLVATDKLNEGIGFAYYYHDEEDPHWQTACANGFRLENVTHYALRPALPSASGQ